MTKYDELLRRATTAGRRNVATVALLGRGSCRARLGDAAGAEGDLRAAIESARDADHAYNQAVGLLSLARVLAADPSRQSEALESLEKAFSVAPQDDRVLRERILVELRRVREGPPSLETLLGGDDG